MTRPITIVVHIKYIEFELTYVLELEACVEQIDGQTDGRTDGRTCNT